MQEPLVEKTNGGDRGDIPAWGKTAAAMAAIFRLRRRAGTFGRKDLPRPPQLNVVPIRITQKGAPFKYGIRKDIQNH
jgi:hypothetical protein